MPNFNDSKWRTCCCHATKGALIIAWVSLVFSIFSLPGIFVPDKKSTSHRNSSILGTFVLSLITCLPIIIGEQCGNGSRKPGMYLPYLILNAIGLVLLTLACVIGIVISLLALLAAGKSSENEVIGYTAVAILIIAVIFLLYTALGWWFFSVVYRAYKYAKEEEFEQYGGGGGVGGQKYVSKA